MPMAAEEKEGLRMRRTRECSSGNIFSKPPRIWTLQPHLSPTGRLEWCLPQLMRRASTWRSGRRLWPAGCGRSALAAQTPCWASVNTTPNNDTVNTTRNKDSAQIQCWASVNTTPNKDSVNTSHNKDSVNTCHMDSLNTSHMGVIPDRNEVNTRDW